MPLPIDVAGDWRRLNADLLRDVQYRAYDPEADAHGEPEECVGVRGPVTRGHHDGAPVSKTTWTVTGLTDTPTLDSRIVDGADTWVITDVRPDPAAGTVIELDAYKTR